MIEIHHADIIIPQGAEAKAREFYCDLAEKGYIIKEQVQLPGMLRIESEDPFGHRLEFLQITL